MYVIDFWIGGDDILVLFGKYLGQRDLLKFYTVPCAFLRARFFSHLFTIFSG